MAYYGTLRIFVWKVFPPQEITATRSHIRAFLADPGPFFPSEVESDALSLASDVDRTVYSIRKDNKNPDELALILITNVLARLLPSGRYHIYRGILSGTGLSMLAMWSRSLTHLRERGYYTEDQLRKDQDWIREQVREAG